MNILLSEEDFKQLIRGKVVSLDLPRIDININVALEDIGSIRIEQLATEAKIDYLKSLSDESR